MPNALKQYAEARPTPRNKLMGLLADTLTRANEYATLMDPRYADRRQNQTLGLLADAVSLGSLAKTAERMSYGEPLTNAGKANVPFMKPETADALMMAPLSPRNALAMMGAGMADTGAMKAALMVAPRADALKVAQRNAAKSIVEGGLGLRANNTAAERAAAMGFDDGWLHGSPKNWQKYKLSAPRQADGDFYGTGVSLTKSGDDAAWYAGEDSGAMVYPMKTAGKFYKHDASMGYITPEQEQALKAAGFAGVDATDASGVFERVVFDPKNIRSEFAAFDPKKRNSANILAGVGAGGLGLASLLEERKGR